MLGRVRNSNWNVYFKPNRRPHRQKHKKIMEIFIIIAVMVITVLLSRYAIAEGQRIEQKKKFMKNMNKYKTTKIKYIKK